MAALLAFTAGPPAAAAPVPGSSCPVFPADNAWHADVSGLPVHPSSDAWLAAMGGPTRRLHPDFGPAGPGERPYGIPYVVVPGARARVPVAFEYADESDPGPYPLAADTPIEGGSDRHALIIDRDRCVLYELYATEYDPAGSRAGSGAVWDLRSNALRPATWTSADAAGLPILAGLVRRDEVAAGLVDHAIRVTAQRTDRSWLWPARHQAGAARDPALPPMGARFRLKAGFDVGRFRPDTQVVLRAMQRHGVLLADNGSNWFLTGTSEEGWDTRMLDELKSVAAASFEAVDASSLVVDPDSGQVRGGAGAAQVAPPPTTTGAPNTTTTIRARPPAVPTTVPVDPTSATTGPPPSSTTTTPAAGGVGSPGVRRGMAAAPDGPDEGRPVGPALGGLGGLAAVGTFARRRLRRPPGTSA